MAKESIDITQMYGEKIYIVKYNGLSFSDKIKFCYSILRNRKIVFNAREKVNVNIIKKKKAIEDAKHSK